MAQTNQSPDGALRHDPAAPAAPAGPPPEKFKPGGALQDVLDALEGKSGGSRPLMEGYPAVVTLDACLPTKAAVKMLAKALKKQDPPTVTTLSVRYNDIGDEGAMMLAKALETNETLESLYMLNTNISDDKKQVLFDEWKKHGAPLSHRWASERSKVTLYRKVGTYTPEDRPKLMPPWALEMVSQPPPKAKGGGGGKKKK